MPNRISAELKNVVSKNFVIKKIFVPQSQAFFYLLMIVRGKTLHRNTSIINDDTRRIDKLHH